MEAVFPGLAAALNPHPMLVHFPIALWLTALLFWTLALWLRRDALWDAGRWLLYLGSLGALAAVGTGLWAAEQLGHDSPGHELVHVHRNWMLLASALGLAVTIAAFATRRRAIPRARWLLSGLLSVVALLVMLGADRGALLVFRYGLGTTGGAPAASRMHADPGRDTEGAQHRHGEIVGSAAAPLPAEPTHSTDHVHGPNAHGH
jgi:uncharacterized membrane protein